MSSVVDLVEPDHLAQLATPANLRLGREIAAGGGVTIVDFNPCCVTARVSNGQRRTVELNSTPQGLAWRCTCTKRPGLFCKHCVAVAVATWEEAPPLGARNDLDAWNAARRPPRPKSAPAGTRPWRVGAARSSRRSPGRA
jgi:uncharacterized Zn finger protein